MPRPVCVFSNNGGSGKTAIAVHLALARSQLSPTALLDTDPQGTATEWLKRRPADLKSPVTVAGRGREAAERELQLAREERYRFVVIDLPPHATAKIAWLLQEAGLILVPTRPTAADLVTPRQTVYGMPSTPIRKVIRSIHQAARNVARDIATTDRFGQSGKDRKKVDLLFARMKRILGLDRLRLRGRTGARDELLLTAIAQNLRRMAIALQPRPLQTIPIPT